MKLSLKFFLVVGIVLKVFDMLTTYVALSYSNAVERSPVVAELIRNIGLESACISVTVLYTLLVVHLFMKQKKGTLIFICFLMLGVVTNNLYKMDIMLKTEERTINNEVL